VSYGEDYNFGWKLAIDNGEGKLAERGFAEFGKISRPTLWRCCNFPDCPSYGIREFRGRQHTAFSVPR
jgi:hypothetical protein